MMLPGLRGKCLKYLDIQFYEPFSKVMDLIEGYSIPKLVRGWADEYRSQLY